MFYLYMPPIPLVRWPLIHNVETPQYLSLATTFSLDLESQLILHPRIQKLFPGKIRFWSEKSHGILGYNLTEKAKNNRGDKKLQMI